MKMHRKSADNTFGPALPSPLHAPAAYTNTKTMEGGSLGQTRCAVPERHRFRSPAACPYICPAIAATYGPSSSLVASLNTIRMANILASWLPVRRHLGDVIRRSSRIT